MTFNQIKLFDAETVVEVYFYVDFISGTSNFILQIFFCLFQTGCSSCSIIDCRLESASRFIYSCFMRAECIAVFV